MATTLRRGSRPKRNCSGSNCCQSQQSTLLSAYAALREMVALVGSDYPMEAEPAHVFVPAAEERRS